jgi:hypothetical protein
MELARRLAHRFYFILTAVIVAIAAVTAAATTAVTAAIATSPAPLSSLALCSARVAPPPTHDSLASLLRYGFWPDQLAALLSLSELAAVRVGCE